MIPNLNALKGAKEDPAMTKDSTFFIGLDLGDKYSYLAILDGDGEPIEEARLPSTPSAIERKFR
jgi:predicted NBD/HSP70 family sugar kinase